MLMRHMSNDWIVNDNRLNDRRVNQSDFRKVSFSRERDQSWKSQDLCDYIFCTFRRCAFHFNLFSICILKTRTWWKDYFTTSQTLIDVCMSHFAMFLVKCINSYLIDAKTILWREFHSRQCSCIFFNNRQLLIVLIS
jgi:hypothetical protein